ncbi:adenosylcobinamide-GDP ribazoletransferase [Salinispira pacifica]
MNGFLSAMRFLTVIPVPRSAASVSVEFGESLRYFPLVGLIIGVAVGGANLVAAALFPRLLAAAVTLAVWIWITGALHLDGFADSADGLLAARPPSERLRIMKDVSIGAFGVVALVVLLLTKFAAIAGLLTARPPDPILTAVLFCAPLFGRSAMVYEMIRFPPAAATGLGAVARLAVRPAHLVAAAALSLLVPVPLFAFTAAAWMLYPVLLLSIAAAELFGRFVRARAGGFTGDTYGAACEIVEAAAMAAAAALAAPF